MATTHVATLGTHWVPTHINTRKHRHTQTHPLYNPASSQKSQRTEDIFARSRPSSGESLSPRSYFYINFIKFYIENFATAVVARRGWGARAQVWADQRTSSGGPSELRILRRILALTSARTSAAAAAPGSPPGLCKHLARAAHSERRWNSRRARTSHSTQGAVKSGACHADCSKRGAWRGAWCVVRGAWCVVRGAWCVLGGSYARASRRSRSIAFLRAARAWLGLGLG